MALDFNTEPYFDDYQDNKDFYRVLFRPSYAVQARELTQLQTILQNQVSRFGNHVFKNGSQVIPGSVNVDNKVHFIKLEQFTGTVDITTYIETLKNKIITGETSGVKMRVLDTSGGSAVVDDLNIPTLYCKIEGTAEDNETRRLLPGENITALIADNQISTNFRLKEDQLNDITAVVKLTGNLGETPTTYTNNASSDVLGYGYSVDVGAGVYFVDGLFVRNDDLKLYVSRFTNNPSCRVGFKVTEAAITPEDDDSILDNATGSYNFAAPGAHRYQIKLSLVKLDLVATDNIRFVELVRIVDGRVQQKIQSASYAELEKTMARRTYDESGNYEVNKFKISVREHANDGSNQGVYAPLADGAIPVDGVTYGDTDKIVVVVDPGKAYVKGYEIESVASRFIEINKAREIDGDEGNHIQRVTTQTIGLNIGNYADVKNVYKAPSISTFEKVYLTNKLQPRVATVTATVNGSNQITGFTIIDGGEGYTSAPTVTIVPSTGAGSGASATAVITNGKVTGFTSIVGGTNYSQTYPPEVRLTSNISVGAAPSSSDIVGTARVRSFQLESGIYNTTSTIYKLGLFDVQMFSGYSFERDVKSIVGQSSSANFTADINPVYTQLSGTGSINHNSNALSGQGTIFTDQVKVGDIVYVNDIKVGTVGSIGGNYSITLSSNYVSDSSSNITNGRITIFTAVLNEPSQETLLFPVGSSNIKTLRGLQNGADTLKNTSLVVRRQFPIMNTATNKAQFDVTNIDETFLSDSDLSNYTLINADSNLPVNVTASMITFNDDSLRKTVYFNWVPNGNYYLIASVQQTATAGQEKVKALDKLNGDQIITDKRIINSTTIDLNYADIFKLVSVEMTPGSYTWNSAAAVDITDRYELDNGQRSTYYTYGKIKLKPGYQVPSGAIRIRYWFFAVSNLYDGNYFSVDSYTTSSGVSYGEIPSYFITDSSSGKKTEISLTDVIDFRPILTTTNSFTPQLPKLGSDMITPHANYVGRIDKIALDSFGKFNVITGVPGTEPKEPEDLKDGMSIATIKIPPYTKSSKDVVVTQKDNRRYTMRDIGRLERRISNLEYYVSLSLLEKDTAELQVTDATTGLDRFKNGFIVDQFTGHNVGDVQNPDYRVSIDTENRILRPMHYTNAIDIVEDLASGSDRGNKSYQKTGDLITLPYVESDFIFNNNATRTMDIHAISMGAFKGQINLFPEGDNWKSINRKPDLVAVDDNNYDAIKYMADQLGVTGTKWNEWQTNWTALSSTTKQFETRQWVGRIQVTGYEQTFTDWTGYQTRDGIQTTLTSSNNAQSYGDRVVDMSYIPYMRSRPITFIATNLKGKTRFWPFFDNVPVSDYVIPADKFVVQRVGNSLMNFSEYDLQNNILQDDPKRAFNGQKYYDVIGEDGGRVEPAFGIGDVLTNTTHTSTNIVSISNLTYPSTTFTLVVSDSTGIKPGHHVVLHNLNYNNSIDLKTYDDYSGGTIPSSVGIVSTTSTSKELNLKKFKVTAVSGGTITLANVDGSIINAFSAYSTASYSDLNRGKLYRLKASGVVSHGGDILTSDSYGPITQEIYVVNIKNGIAVGETLTGSVTIGTTGSYNGVTVTSINDSTSLLVAPTMQEFGDKIVTDNNGLAVGVFYIPQTEELSFRTGERTFKLTDNQSNSNASFDSIGSAVYYAQGISLDKERTIVSSRSVEFVTSANYQDSRDLGIPNVRRTTTDTKVLYQYQYDPLAQTFTVNSPGCCFITSIDLYFAEAGRRPISVELRNTDNGVPSSTKVIPFSRVTKTPDQISTSDDSSVATTYKFKSPIYLQDNETYAFVVLTDEPGAQIYVSEMGQTDMLTGNTIAGQPLTGSLYASQNAREWEIHTLLDAKFNLRIAKFNTNTNCELYLRNSDVEKITLENNPLHITKNSTKIRVYAQNHGLLAGNTFTLSGFAPGYYGAASTTLGIPHSLLNTTHTVLASGLETDSFVFNLTTVDLSSNNLLSGTSSDFITGDYGGTGLQITRGMFMDTMFLKSSDLVFPDTKIDYYVKTMDRSQTFTGYVPFITNNNLNFTTRMHVPSKQNYVSVNSVVVPPVQIRAVLSSSNENISPVIDIQQLSLFAVSNRINNQTASDINIAEIDTRVLLKATDLISADLTLTGTGTVTSSGTSVTGSSTSFTTQVVAGNVLCRTSDNAIIGTVLTVNSNTSITLTATATTTVSGVAFYIKSTPNLVFENTGPSGVGVIRTNIDTADNLLTSAGIGKTMVISGVATGIDGTYVVKNIIVVEDKTTYAGNAELDTTKIILDKAFGTTATIDMITDPDFNISVYDKYVDDIAPYGVHNSAQYVTRTLSLTEAATVIKVLFDGNIVNNTSIKVFYRTWVGDTDLRKLPWTDTGYVSDSYDQEGKYVEREVNIKNLTPFNNIQIKVAFKSSNPTYIPKLKNLRLIALS